METRARSVHAPAAADTPAAALPVRTPTAGERDALLAWLDDGLRRGERGRLAAEHPLALAAGSPADHRVVGGAPGFLAHAMGTETRVRTPAGSLAVGLIGLVYTAPTARRRGLASRCVEACVAELRRRGAGLALLWSDRPEIYRRLGFVPLGRETDFAIDAALLAGIGTPPGLVVEPFDPLDPAQAPDLERLYEAHGSRAFRPPGSLASLASAPDTRLRVVRRGGAPVAYVAAGRGDDFRGVVHEWAGELDGVLAGLAALCSEPDPPSHVLTGPDTGEPSLAGALERAGAPRRRRPFALGRALDPTGLWETLVPGADAPGLARRAGRLEIRGARSRCALSERELVELLFEGPSRRVMAALDRRQRRALAAVLPCPLYLWGFDSF